MRLLRQSLSLVADAGAERKGPTGVRIHRLDGIRGVAFCLVFGIHALNFVPGWTGVDLFFVLSGFLITGILRRDRETPRYWSSFYIKRATRILPPLLIFFLAAWWLVDIPWRHIGWYYVLFAANIAEAKVPRQGKEIAILWSLAVEEHFYLFWPFAVRYLSRRNLIRLLIAVLCVEPVVRGVFTPVFRDSWSMYVLTPFRLDSLAAGSLLSLLLEDNVATDRLRRYSRPAAITALVSFVITGLIPSFRPDWHALWFNLFGYSLVAFMGVAWINYTLFHENAWQSRVLASRPLVFIGLISYGAYLYHELILVTANRILVYLNFNHMRTVLPLTAAVIMLVSWVSYRFYELPIMRWGKHVAASRARHAAAEHAPAG